MELYETWLANCNHSKEDDLGICLVKNEMRRNNYVHVFILRSNSIFASQTNLIMDKMFLFLIKKTHDKREVMKIVLNNKVEKATNKFQNKHHKFFNFSSSDFLIS